MSEIRYRNLRYKGRIRWLKRGKKRYLHVNCFMNFDVLYIKAEDETVYVVCGLCGKTLTIPNGNSDKRLMHKCHQGSTFLPVVGRT